MAKTEETINAIKLDNPIRKNILFLCKILLGTEVTQPNNNVHERIIRGLRMEESTTRVEIGVDNTHKSNIRTKPIQKLNEKALSRYFLLISLCCTTAAPIPVSASEAKTDIIAVIAAKYPKSSLLNNRDIIEKKNSSVKPIVNVTTVWDETPFITLCAAD